MLRHDVRQLRGGRRRFGLGRLGIEIEESGVARLQGEVAVKAGLGAPGILDGSVMDEVGKFAELGYGIICDRHPALGQQRPAESRSHAQVIRGEHGLELGARLSRCFSSRLEDLCRPCRAIRERLLHLVEHALEPAAGVATSVSGRKCSHPVGLREQLLDARGQTPRALASAKRIARAEREGELVASETFDESRWDAPAPVEDPLAQFQMRCSRHAPRSPCGSPLWDSDPCRVMRRREKARMSVP